MTTDELIDRLVRLNKKQMKLNDELIQELKKSNKALFKKIKASLV